MLCYLHYAGVKREQDFSHWIESSICLLQTKWLCLWKLPPLDFQDFLPQYYCPYSSTEILDPLCSRQGCCGQDLSSRPTSHSSVAWSLWITENPTFSRLDAHDKMHLTSKHPLITLRTLPSGLKRLLFLTFRIKYTAQLMAMLHDGFRQLPLKKVSFPSTYWIFCNLYVCVQRERDNLDWSYGKQEGHLNLYCGSNENSLLKSCTFSWVGNAIASNDLGF